MSRMLTENLRTGPRSTVVSLQHVRLQHVDKTERWQLTEGSVIIFIALGRLPRLVLYTP